MKIFDKIITYAIQILLVVIQFLVIFLVYSISPEIISYIMNPSAPIYMIHSNIYWFQVILFCLAIVGAFGSVVIINAKGYMRFIGLFLEGLYLFAVIQLYNWVMYLLPVL